MPATLDQISPQLIGHNQQELANRLALSSKPKIKLPFSFATTDGTLLLTIPALTNGAIGLLVEQVYWEITTSFTGGASTAIGISSTNANFNSNGDLLGGTVGDGLVGVSLVSTGLTYKRGTIGTKLGVSNPLVYLVTGDSIKFNRIASAFTAGAGFVHVHASWVD